MTTLTAVTACTHAWCTRPHDEPGHTYHESRPFAVHTTHGPVEVTLSQDSAADPETLIEVCTDRGGLLLEPVDAAELVAVLSVLLREARR